jgi:AcrR family transcriptional regulator
MVLFTRLLDSLAIESMRGGRKSVSERGRRELGESAQVPEGSQEPQRPPRVSGGRTIEPIYKRLPKGPHGIDPSDVAHHQRIRMHGAMIEAVATRGYQNTSVRHVIGLAGVSRRAFYEQFANKEECFMETFDLVVNRGISRINQAYRSAPGGMEERMRTAFGAFEEEVATNSKALQLVMIEAQAVSPEGLRRLQRTTGMFEGLLSNSFSDPHRPDALPLPVVRAIVGGLRRAVFLRLRDGSTEGLSELTEEMLRWSLIFKSPAVRVLQQRPCLSRPFPQTIKLRPGPRESPDDRLHLLRSAVNLMISERYDELSSLRIADEAGVEVETFLELFPTKEACCLAALEMLGDELLLVVADPSLVSEEWPAAVCRAVDSLLVHLAVNPARLVVLATKVFDAGPLAIEGTVDLAHQIATLLTEGAPHRPCSKIAVEGIAGALWHTFNSEVLAGQGHRLPALSEYLSYVVLTPFIGPNQAAQAVQRSRREATKGRLAAMTSKGTATSNGTVDRAIAINGTRCNGVVKPTERRSQTAAMAL